MGLVSAFIWLKLIAFGGVLRSPLKGWCTAVIESTARGILNVQSLIYSVLVLYRDIYGSTVLL